MEQSISLQSIAILIQKKLDTQNELSSPIKSMVLQL
jgi:hypothetical protein